MQRSERRLNHDLCVSTLSSFHRRVHATILSHGHSCFVYDHLMCPRGVPRWQAPGGSNITAFMATPRCWPGSIGGCAEEMSYGLPVPRSSSTQPCPPATGHPSTWTVLRDFASAIDGARDVERISARQTEGRNDAMLNVLSVKINFGPT